MSLTSSPALSSSLASPIKRKATAFEEDSENVDPVIFLSKQSKGINGKSFKPTNFFLTKAPPSPSDLATPFKPASAPARPVLQPKSPAPKLNTDISKSLPLTAPAGRSPTRKRVGILNRRRTASPFTRVDPPKFAATTSLGFSINEALSSTVPSHGARQRHASVSSRERAIPASLHEPESKASWFFDIHEDTPEEEATNLMEHSTCTLDISSDEESAARMKDERGKENVPPPDDISQTRTLANEVAAAESSMSDMKARARAHRRRKEIDNGAIDVDRCPLGEMPAEEFYAEGCDGGSVFLVPSEAADAEEDETDTETAPAMKFDFVAELKGKTKEVDVDALMRKDDCDIAKKAALLEPLEKAEADFELWESGSAKGDE